MAYAHTTHTSTSGILDRIAEFYNAAQEARSRRRIYRQTVEELGALSNRELADIGIQRSMIAHIALEAADGHRGLGK